MKRYAGEAFSDGNGYILWHHGGLDGEGCGAGYIGGSSTGDSRDVVYGVKADRWETGLLLEYEDPGRWGG